MILGAIFLLADHTDTKVKTITRIAYNSADWHHPTGDAARQEMEGSYNNVNRFGHEDWLFRDEWPRRNSRDALSNVSRLRRH